MAPPATAHAVLSERRPDLVTALWEKFRAREPELAAAFDEALEVPCGPGCRACPEMAPETAQEPAGRPSGS